MRALKLRASMARCPLSPSLPTPQFRNMKGAQGSHPTPAIKSQSVLVSLLIDPENVILSDIPFLKALVRRQLAAAAPAAAQPPPAVGGGRGNGRGRGGHWGG